MVSGLPLFNPLAATVMALPLTGWTITHNWSPQTPTLCLVGLPFLIAGLSLGEYLHHKLDGPAFRATVNGVLILNGIVLILFAR